MAIKAIFTNKKGLVSVGELYQRIDIVATDTSDGAARLAVGVYADEASSKDEGGNPIATNRIDLVDYPIASADCKDIREKNGAQLYVWLKAQDAVLNAGTDV